MILYHCTTPKKLKRYQQTGCILPPVRGWCTLETAKLWAKKTHRSIILKIIITKSTPLNTHQPRGFAYITDEFVRTWEEINV